MFLRFGFLIFLLVILVQGVVPTIVAGKALVYPLRKYAQLWDSRHAEIIDLRESGAQSLVVLNFSKEESLWPLREKLWVSGDFEDFPDYWINRCAAAYYGVEEIYGE